MHPHWQSDQLGVVDYWGRIKNRLASVLEAQAYKNWVDQTSQESWDHGTLTVWVPDAVTKDFLELEYRSHVRAAISSEDLPVDTIVYLAKSGTPSKPAATSNFEPRPQSFSNSPISGRLCFDNYVVGTCNQFAHAAARAVATNPSRSYNPLFIYGGVGMGKTHLLQAIGSEMLARYPGLRILYTSGERFMNDMIACIRSNTMPAFQRYYRSADVLLIDDVQIIAGKERTQEEFFHTFNDLFESGKQIVLTSDRRASEIQKLESRLVSRFEWGLPADIQAPDMETRVATLRAKAAEANTRVPDEVLHVIAARYTNNIRELEGALIRVTARASLDRLKISMELAEKVIADLRAKGMKI